MDLGLWTDEALRNITLIVTAFITGVLSPIVANWTKNKFAQKKAVIEEEETDEILKFLHANEVIDKRIESIRSEYNFDRVWIAQFHNGGSFYPANKAAFKFQKFSLTYESCRLGVSSELSGIQNIPTSIFATILRKVKENGHYGVHDIEAASDDSSTLKSFWNDRGVYGFHIFAIKCLDKKFLGFMVVDCLSKCELSNELVENLVVESKILGGYLPKEIT